MFSSLRALPSTTARDESSSSEEEDDSYEDRVYGIDAFCNLDCGADGECLMEREDGTAGGGNVVRKRCLCPHGKYGEKCALGELFLVWFGLVFARTLRAN